jgi:hypothetical protein
MPLCFTMIAHLRYKNWNETLDAWSLGSYALSLAW